MKCKLTKAKELIRGVVKPFNLIIREIGIFSSGCKVSEFLLPFIGPHAQAWLSWSERGTVIEIPAKKWGDTEIAERGRSVLVMRARYRSARLTPHLRGWTDAG